MNTIVWVMMVTTTSYNWVIPSMEFNSKEKCEAAIVSMNQQVKEKGRHFFKGFCVKVEK
jgi:hypothetical protein